jgi:hypothetical protein
VREAADEALVADTKARQHGGDAALTKELFGTSKYELENTGKLLNMQQ